MRKILLILFFTVCVQAQDRAADHQQKMAQLENLQVTKAVSPSSRIVFPQIANGSYGGVGYRTSIVLSSNELEDFLVQLQFYSPSGNPLRLDLFSSETGQLVGSGSSVVFNLRGYRTLFLETDGLGDLTTGWVYASAPDGMEMGGVTAYQVFNPISLAISSIVAVGTSAATPAFFAPIFRDESLRTNTAFAIANSSNTTAYIRAYLVDNNSVGTDVMDFQLGPKQQAATYISELFPTIGSRFFGTIHVFRTDANGESLVAFDLHPVALLDSAGILSSSPVTNIVALP